jgi:hypothetical protein
MSLPTGLHDSHEKMGCKSSNPVICEASLFSLHLIFEVRELILMHRRQSVCNKVVLYKCSAVFLQRLKDEVRLHVKINIDICRDVSKKETSCNLITNLATVSIDFLLIHKLCILTSFFPHPPRYIYKGVDKSLARPGRKQTTTTEDFEFHISYL